MSRIRHKLTAVSSDYTMVQRDDTVRILASGITVVAPAASAVRGRQFVIGCEVGSATLSTAGGTIATSANFAFAASYETLVIISDGTNYFAG
jgi:environmental stress-induced protein Ves